MIVVICFLGGFAVSFFYEPESWLKALTEDLNAPLDFIFHAFPDGTPPFKFFAAPYYIAVAAIWAAMVVVFKHFTIGFAVFYAVGIYIVDRWVCILTADNRSRA